MIFAVLWNIDCGSSRNYTDGNNVTWTGDSALVRTGKSKSVQSSYSMTPVQKRTFTVNVDDKPVQPLKPITPTYGNATELSIYNVISSQNTTFRLVSTADSMLPPVISAIELFFILNYTQTSPGPYETPSSKSKLPIILGTGIPGCFCLVAVVAVIVGKYKKKRAAKAAATTNAATSKTGFVSSYHTMSCFSLME